MTPQYKSTIAALKTIPGLTVIPSSWLASKKDWPLPAVIVDLENPIFDCRTEDGALVEISTRMSMIFCVKPDEDDPTIAFAKLENYFWTGLQAIALAFPSKQLAVDLPQIDDFSFGKSQMTFGIGFFLRISEGE